MQKRLTTNFASGALSLAVSLLAAIVATPFYLRLLGVEAFGVLGFVLSLQRHCSCSMANRGVCDAHRCAEPNRGCTPGGADVMHGLARVGWYLAILIAGMVAMLASSVALIWLNLSTLQPSYVAQSLAVAGVAIGARWPLALYQAVLLGASGWLR